MKFYLIEITTYNNGTKDSKGIYEYATRDEAIAAYHSKMGGAMKNETYQTELLMVINSSGGIELSPDRYDRGSEEEMTYLLEA